MRKVLSRGEDIYEEEVFQVLFDHEVNRSKRYPVHLSILCIEMAPVAMDDQTIQAAPALFASALNSHLRSVDIPSKWGHKFKVLLPATDAPGARTVCERLLSIFRNKFDTSFGASIAFTVNIGAATHPGGETLFRDALNQQAETALEQSKLKGHNTFVALS